MELINTFAQSDNPVIALLAFMVVMLISVVVYQWKYTADKTVPKWVWDSIIPKIEHILEVQGKLLTILDERLKK